MQTGRQIVPGISDYIHKPWREGNLPVAAQPRAANFFISDTLVAPEPRESQPNHHFGEGSIGAEPSSPLSPDRRRRLDLTRINQTKHAGAERQPFALFNYNSKSVPPQLGANSKLHSGGKVNNIRISTNKFLVEENRFLSINDHPVALNKTHFLAEPMEKHSTSNIPLEPQVNLVAKEQQLKSTEEEQPSKKGNPILTVEIQPPEQSQVFNLDLKSKEQPSQDLNLTGGKLRSEDLNFNLTKKELPSQELILNLPSEEKASLVLNLDNTRDEQSSQELNHTTENLSSQDLNLVNLDLTKEELASKELNLDPTREEIQSDESNLNLTREELPAHEPNLSLSREDLPVQELNLDLNNNEPFQELHLDFSRGDLHFQEQNIDYEYFNLQDSTLTMIREDAQLPSQLGDQDLSLEDDSISEPHNYYAREHSFMEPKVSKENNLNYVSNDKEPPSLRTITPSKTPFPSLQNSIIEQESFSKYPTDLDKDTSVIFQPGPDIENEPSLPLYPESIGPVGTKLNTVEKQSSPSNLTRPEILSERSQVSREGSFPNSLAVIGKEPGPDPRPNLEQKVPRTEPTSEEPLKNNNYSHVNEFDSGNQPSVKSYLKPAQNEVTKDQSKENVKGPSTHGVHPEPTRGTKYPPDYPEPTRNKQSPPNHFHELPRNMYPPLKHYMEPLWHTSPPFNHYIDTHWSSPYLLNAYPEPSRNTLPPPGPFTDPIRTNANRSSLYTDPVRNKRPFLKPDPTNPKAGEPFPDPAKEPTTPKPSYTPFLLKPMYHIRNWFYGSAEEEGSGEGVTAEGGALSESQDEIDPLINTIDTLTSPQQEPELVSTIRNMTDTIINIIRKDYFENEFKVDNYVSEAALDYEDRADYDWENGTLARLPPETGAPEPPGAERRREPDTTLAILDSIQVRTDTLQ